MTQSTTTSTSRAIAARLAHSTAPRPTRSSTASRLRCATTRSGNPFSTAFFAMPVPHEPDAHEPHHRPLHVAPSLLSRPPDRARLGTGAPVTPRHDTAPDRRKARR